MRLGLFTPGGRRGQEGSEQQLAPKSSLRKKRGFMQVRKGSLGNLYRGGDGPQELEDRGTWGMGCRLSPSPGLSSQACLISGQGSSPK